MPHNVDCFVEDEGHRLVIGALLHRLFDESKVWIDLRFRNAERGRAQVFKRLTKLVADMQGNTLRTPEVLVIAVDANCKSYGPTKSLVDQAIDGRVSSLIIRAIPDPHIERWLLLDSRAFKLAVGSGCDAPDLKCERDRYKSLLAQAVASSGVTPLLGGLEHAEEIVRHMDLERLASSDPSFGHFTADVRSVIGALSLR